MVDTGIAYAYVFYLANPFATGDILVCGLIFNINPTSRTEVLIN